MLVNPLERRGSHRVNNLNSEAALEAGRRGNSMIEMTSKSLAIAIITFACGGCKNAEEVMTGNSSHIVAVPQSRAMARLVIESVCSNYCSEFRVHDIALNQEHDGAFDVSGRVPVNRYRVFTTALDNRLMRMGWQSTAYQIQFDSPEQFLRCIRPQGVSN
jgi:hypothetical protein